jgi:hypothetical protein
MLPLRVVGITMSDEMPARFHVAVRWALGGIILLAIGFVFIDNIDAGHYEKAAWWFLAFVVVFLVVYFWPRVFQPSEPKGHAPRDLRDLAPIPEPAGQSTKKTAEMLAQANLLKAQQMLLKEQRVNSAPLVPDWPIRELFGRIRPGILQTKDKQTFETVAGEIRDKLATSQLEAWGRLISRRDGQMPLYPIPAEYWLYGKLVIWLLDKDGGEILQADVSNVRAPRQGQYGAIQVNRAQSEALWPITTKPVERDTQLADALAYAVTGKWDKDVLWESEGQPIAKVGVALKRFEQLACDGSLQVWGMRQRNLGPYVKIPSDYWETHHVHFMDLFREKARASSYVQADQEGEYFDIMVSGAQFQDAWSD